MNYQEKVRDFQIAGGEDLNSGLTPLREALLKEEIQELEDAIKANDRVEMLDALCDIKYVNDGNANLLGVEQYSGSEFEDYFHLGALNSYESYIGCINNTLYDPSIVDWNLSKLLNLFNFTLENFKTALDRVHLSNMSKFCNTEQEAIETNEKYSCIHIGTYYKQNGNKWVIYRLSDNKILKSKYYTPVDLKDLI